MDDASYVTGFVDGEGSFLISFQRRQKMNTGVEVRPSFTVSQHKRSREILDFLYRFFNCGGIRFNKRDQTYKYEVRSLQDLWGWIIPHFEKYPLHTTKREDFQHFKTICLLMRESKHLSQKGIEQIIDLAYRMNNYGARRYDKTSLLRL